MTLVKYTGTADVRSIQVEDSTLSWNKENDWTLDVPQNALELVLKQNDFSEVKPKPEVSEDESSFDGLDPIETGEL